MLKNVRKLNDGESACGSVNAVTRLGQTVCRPSGPWSLAVHALLRYLAAVDFKYAPRLLNTDQHSETETLSYIDGEVAMRPWPKCLLVEDGIFQVGVMLRAYHDAVVNYEPLSGAVWRDPEAQWHAGMILRHGDLGPWNMVWKSDRLVGLIDWDLLEPGMALSDVAQAAWNCVPLRPDAECIAAGIRLDDRLDRLRALCTAYGTQSDRVLTGLLELQENEIRRTERYGRRGLQPWKIFWDRGDVDKMRAEMRWLQDWIKNSQQPLAACGP